MVRLVLVRHGEVDANRKYHYLGHRDDELNATGSAQAEALADALSVLRFDAVISSPLRRALTTAQSLAGTADHLVGTDRRLMELDFGLWEGRSRSEVMGSGPESRAAVVSWEADSSRATPGGESLRELQVRVTDLADELCRERQGETVVLVSHMGPIKMLLVSALGMPIEAANRIFLDPATISVVDWGSESVVRLVNSHAHLGFGEARWLRDS